MHRTIKWVERMIKKYGLEHAADHISFYEVERPMSKEWQKLKAVNPEVYHVLYQAWFNSWNHRIDCQHCPDHSCCIHNHIPGKRCYKN